MRLPVFHEVKRVTRVTQGNPVSAVKIPAGQPPAQQGTAGTTLLVGAQTGTVQQEL